MNWNRPIGLIRKRERKKETVPIYSENHTKPINTVCEENVVMDIEAVVTTGL
jgi:hypothetical protein